MNNKWRQGPISNGHGEPSPTCGQQPETTVIQDDEGRLHLVPVNSMMALSHLKLKGTHPGVQSFAELAQGLNLCPTNESHRGFLAYYHRHTCFYCLDAGVVTVPLHTDLGVYEYAYQCVCQATASKPIGGKSITPIQSLIDKGYYQLSCQLGGPTGEYCLLERPQSKCQSLTCPKLSTPKQSLTDNKG